VGVALPEQRVGLNLRNKRHRKPIADFVAIPVVILRIERFR
jgi:hypothetical protein